MDQSLARFLNEADGPQLTYFAASCVERASVAFFLAMSLDETRRADADQFLELLESLWKFQSLPRDERRRCQEIAAGFRELQQEEEPPGVFAYAYDAVAAMFYSYAYLVSDDRLNITYCSNHLLNSAGFLDEAAGAGETFVNEEIRAQIGDIDLLIGESGDGTELVPVLRGGSRKIGRHRAEVLNLMASG
ncbi:hypothetical protein ACFHYQ_22590 [Sphaerimonospora cavernae]|uniref:Uncharacterized protein n=1 Tax=Sphaerimonospora cavernae TaxID=1740611 RepID=A0ABV6UA67_9ACTN